MTNLVTNAPDLVSQAVRDEAVVAAEAAAVASGVEVRLLTEVSQLTAVSRLFGSIWRPGSDTRPVPTELLRAMVAAGNYVAGAFDHGELLGACFGFFGHPRKGSLHSHIAGVAAPGLGRGIGYALKLHQRGWALLQDVSLITWTFDPLVRRNAHFNLSKLGTHPLRYLPDFYGPMVDDINGSGDTDRLLVGWDLASPVVRAAALGEPGRLDAAELRDGGAAIALSVGPDGGPLTGSADAPTVLVAVPPDIESLRRNDSALGGAWRVALREALGGLMAQDARVVGFDRAGWYVIAREQS
ncbi:GNAT family N-acetyltransferase [Solihabitans fulvus]|uniref:GNAT family N-acetyltransferase n=1 Tax=Solihabitans fulvus TaxID=1892852 RepID=A0A5B2XER9_9PSEU|nr:GNAT family N-acetyltransferase [Solihabitans fulvus]KAA2261450.1 GNAT family N-acetyltransferase [Solihabitans fulvus]